MRFHRRGLCCAAAVAVVLTAAPAHAWGPEAHGIIAAMAEAHLSKTAGTEVMRLLAQDTDDDGNLRPRKHLDQVSSWADAYRPAHPETGPWHYVDIPLDKPGYDDARDCHKNQRGRPVAARSCIVAKLPEFAHLLADRRQSDARRREALKYLVHLVGDIAQPFHAETRYDARGRSDRGGNAVRLTYDNQQTNLHLVWDQGIVEEHYNWPAVEPPEYGFDHKAARAAARIMDARIDPHERATWAKPGLLRDLDAQTVAWANESHALVAAAYDNLPMNKPGASEDDYQAYAWPVVERQLQKASVRLAELLNEILG
jgi:hypothetical protein